MRFIKLKNKVLINANELILLCKEGTEIIASVKGVSRVNNIVIYKGDPRVVDLVYCNLTSELLYDDNSPDIGALAERATKAIEKEEEE